MTLRHIPLFDKSGKVQYFSNHGFSLNPFSRNTASDLKSKQQYFENKIRRLPQGFQVAGSNTITASILGQNDEAVKRHQVLLRKAAEKNRLDDFQLLLRGAAIPRASVGEQAATNTNPSVEQFQPPPQAPPAPRISDSISKHLAGKKSPASQPLVKQEPMVLDNIQDQLISELKDKLSERSRSAPRDFLDSQGNIIAAEPKESPQREVSKSPEITKQSGKQSGKRSGNRWIQMIQDTSNEDLLKNLENNKYKVRGGQRTKVVNELRRRGVDIQ